VPPKTTHVFPACAFFVGVARVPGVLETAPRVRDAIQRRRTPRDAAFGDANARTHIHRTFLARVTSKLRVASSRIPPRSLCA
jgi:hypothetical protein